MRTKKTATDQDATSNLRERLAGLRRKVFGAPFPPIKPPRPAVDDDRLMCAVRSLTYEFTSKTGHLRMEAGDCTDMKGCIAIFEQIDPTVKTIFTWSGADRDTSYHCFDGRGWIAQGPDRKNRAP